jgi:hypothetical protein
MQSARGSFRWCTSVDLVNATDGLPLEISRGFLEVANKNATYVPPEIMDFALSSLGSMVGGRMISHGQMMGIYLSFPLLCCHSYTAASWASRDVDASFKVNGDDCVIFANRPVLSREYPPGYEINDNKTVRSQNVVEFNSTVFLTKRGGFREVRNLRRGGFDPSTFAGMIHGANACRKLGAKWVDAFVRSRIGTGWGFLPSQLGFLETKSHAAFRRERELRERDRRQPSPLPEPPLVVSELLLMKTGSPDTDEIAALISHQWQYGREKKKRDDVFSPSVGQVRKTYIYPKCREVTGRPRLIRRTYQVHLAELLLFRKEDKSVYFVPREYTSEREERGVLDLWNWRNAIS